MTIRNLTDALTTCGLNLPESAAALVATRDALSVDRDTHRIEQIHEVVDSLTPDNAIEHVERITRQRVEVELRSIVSSQLIAAVEARAARAVQAEADTLIAAHRKTFDAAAKIISKHAAAFGPTDPAESVLARGTEAAKAWSAILDASAVLDASAHLWSTLYERPATTDALVATFDGNHWRRIDSEEVFESGRWHGLVAAGYALRLNTYAESAALIAATPERALRWDPVRKDGFTAAEPVRA